MQLEFYWAETEAPKRHNITINEYGDFIHKSAGRNRDPQRLIVVVERALPGSRDIAYHRIIELLIEQPGCTVEFKGFPDWWW